MSDFNEQEIIDLFVRRFAMEENDEPTAYDYIEMAQSAKSKKKAIEYASKALELEPENLDAEKLIVKLQTKSSYELLEKYKELLEKANTRMKEQGYFDEENIGSFWGIFETRPYMRLMMDYAFKLIECNRIKSAGEIYREMLRLCEGDNLGVRYNLMHIYLYFEDEESALNLAKQFEDEAEYATQFLLPLSMLYYKKGDTEKAAEYLKALNDNNKDTYKFFDGVLKRKLEEYAANMDSFGYRPDTIEEFLMEFQYNSFVFALAEVYFEWGLAELKNMKKKKKS